MISLLHKPSQENKLVFGEQDISRLDLAYDAKFKQLAEMDEANTWFLNIVSCANDKWDEFPASALSKFQLTLGNILINLTKRITYLHKKSQPKLTFSLTTKL